MILNSNDVAETMSEQSVNLRMCQKPGTFSFQDSINHISKTPDEFDDDPMNFWKLHQVFKLRKLFRIAKIIYCIPSSSTSSERVTGSFFFTCSNFGMYENDHITVHLLMLNFILSKIILFSIENVNPNEL